MRSNALRVWRLVACNNCFASASGLGHGARQRVPLGWGRVAVSRAKAPKRRDSSSPVRERWVAVNMRSSAEGAKDASDFRPFRAAGEGCSNPALTHWARRVSPLRGLARSVLSGVHSRGTAFSHSREISFFDSLARAKQLLQATSGTCMVAKSLRHPSETRSSLGSVELHDLAEISAVKFSVLQTSNICSLSQTSFIARSRLNLA
jgi:hypothetical protein